ncbi:uncharacterized protein LY89DRAFT_779802 [Mollisia scopiformis]|uniref:alpha-galactosidase n=1 Tax=Mollisia scopiformis TaxID=149040 RepID=A0A194XI68_MOLSC|nr:uncharacterized protein LY89DRAFT_779802 [Mollisia scopiformis]KUJ19920.1 hypothetical protein LY89DRAFT_779802 [Mollisia scopiformis]
MNLPSILLAALLSSSLTTALNLRKRYDEAPFKPTKCAVKAKVTQTAACPISGLPDSTGGITLTIAPEPTSWSKPSPSSLFQVVLQNNTEVRASVDDGIDVYDIDIDSSAATFASLIGAGKYVVCYFSAGTMETWRSDFGCFNHNLGAQDLGCDVGGPWANEFWVNTSSTEVRKIMQARIQRAADLGCSAIDPDNMDGYGNQNGIGATEEDSISYVKFLSREARSRGMGISLKNALEILPNVTSDVDFGVNEQCNEYDECDSYTPFWALPTPLPVFNIEYPPHNKDNWTEKYAEKSCDESLDWGYPYMFTDLKNYPTVTCAVSRCTEDGPSPAVPNGGLVIPSGCVDGMQYN